MIISGQQVGTALGLLRWTVQDLADASALPFQIVKLAVRSTGKVDVTTAQAIVLKHALDKAGVTFSSDGVALRTAKPT